MRILLTGATGFIGQRLARALRERGHRVIAASRRPPPGDDAVQADFSTVPSAAWWTEQLRGFDAVVNAVGILREAPGQTFQALHADAPMALFEGAALAGVARVVQVSALGADDEAQSRYHRTKRDADEFLRRLPLTHAIVQPSLVYGPGGDSAAFFDQLAVAPVLPFPGRGDMPVQPVHVDDVVEGIVQWLEALEPDSGTYVFAGPRPMAMREYLAELRSALGESSRQWVLPVPGFLFRLTAAVAGRIPGSMLDSETAGMLLRGNATDRNALPGLLGRAPRATHEFFPPAEAEPRRREAALGLWLPVLRLSIALLWIWTAVVSLGLYPVQDSYALLARVGLHGAAATVALYGAALLDLALGVLTLAAPARWRRPVWLGQMALIGGYTLLITAFLPEYWLHPYGPLSKNLPMLAGIALLWALEPPPRRRGG